MFLNRVILLCMCVYMCYCILFCVPLCKSYSHKSMSVAFNLHLGSEIDWVKCLQAEARVLIVGMMGKILAGDLRGISAVVLERLQQTMTQVGFIFHMYAY